MEKLRQLIETSQKIQSIRHFFLHEHFSNLNKACIAESRWILITKELIRNSDRFNHRTGFDLYQVVDEAALSFQQHAQYRTPHVIEALMGIFANRFIANQSHLPFPGKPDAKYDCSSRETSYCHGYNNITATYCATEPSNRRKDPMVVSSFKDCVGIYQWSLNERTGYPFYAGITAVKTL